MFISFMDSTACLFIEFHSGLFIDSFLPSFLQGSIWTDMDSCFSDTSQHVSMLNWAFEFS